MNTESTGIAPTTSAADAPAQAPASSPAPSPAAQPSQATPAQEVFLEVNPRTKYATRDEAIRGYTEAQNRIAALSVWEKLNSAPEKGGLGFVNLKSPDDVAALLDELIELRAKGQPASGAAATQPNQPAGVDQLSPEIQAWIKTLKEKAGFVDRDTLAALESRLDQFDQRSAGEEAARVEAAVSHGTSILASEMKEAGLPEDKELLEEIGAAIGGKIDRDSYDAQGNLIQGSLADKFIRGSEPERRAIIKEHFQRYLKFGETYATAKNANYAAQKTAAVASTPRPLTQSGAPSPAAPAPTTGKQRWDHSDINRKVRELMSTEASRLGG